MRGYLNNVNDLKADPVILSSNIVCFTETHLRNSDIIHRNTQPTKSHIPYRQDRVGGVQKGGIMILVNHQIPSTRLDINIPGLESLTTSISPTRTTKIVIVTLYRRSSTVSIERFIAMIEQLLTDTALLHAQITSGW